MKLATLALAATLAGLTLVTGSGTSTVHAQAAAPLVNGLAPVTLTRKPTPGATKPEFTSITLLPGRGLMVQQITAYFPGKGEVDVLASPSLEEAAKTLNEPGEFDENKSYKLGAAFLFPYPNRIRGPLSPDGKSLNTNWEGRTVLIPANNIGEKPGAERHALHGLILKSKAEDLKIKTDPAGSTLTAVIRGGDFNGQWFSKTDLVFTIALTANSVDASIVAHNTGSQPEPVAFAWHPYFNIPSGDRSQLRLHIPASEMAEVDNYDNVFPTGKILPVKGTRFDFTAPDGKPLGKDFLDDNFSKFAHPAQLSSPLTVTIVDPKADYGVHIEGLSPNVSSVQVYAPPAKNFIAIEHQTNFADPFGKEWNGPNGKFDTKMITLAPGKSTQWHVRLQVFAP